MSEELQHLSLSALEFETALKAPHEADLWTHCTETGLCRCFDEKILVISSYMFEKARHTLLCPHEVDVRGRVQVSQAEKPHSVCPRGPKSRFACPLLTAQVYADV